MDKESRRKNSISIKCSCRCDKGNIRDNNEDNYYFQGMFLDADNESLDKTLTVSMEADEIKDHGIFMAVFDGMGGVSHGELAAYEATKYADEFKSRFTRATVGGEADMLAALCKGMNMRVHSAAIKSGVSVMGTTMASLYFYGDQVWSCNVGDSRCYRYRAGVLEQLSVDHVEELYYIDRINWNRKPGLIQYIGMDPEEILLEPAISGSDVQDEDNYLICSDGLTDMVTEADIAAMISDASDTEEAANSLVDMALANGGKDNITVIVCRCRL